MIQKISVFFILIVITAGCQTGKLYDADAIFITNINVIDPLEGLKINQTILIKGGRIERVAPSSEFNLSSENNIIKGDNKFLIPGLWDAHIHFAYIEDLAPKMFDLFLGYGITSVRDTGGKKDFVNYYRNLSRQNPQSSPRVMIAGPLLDGVPNVYDGSDEGHPPLSVKLKTTADVEKLVRTLDSMQVDFFKAYEMLSPEQFVLLMKLAKERNLKVTGHVPLSMDVISASNAGLSSMEHFRNLELSCASNANELLQQRIKILAAGRNKQGGTLRSDIHNAQREVAIKNFDTLRANEVLRALKSNNTWQIPTITLNTFSTELFIRKSWWKESIQFLPDKIRTSWEQSAMIADTSEVSEFRKSYSEWMFRMVKMVHQDSIPIMAGTDAPIALQTPGASLHNELVMLVKGGLTPLEALRAATINPARYFGLEKELGLIHEGYRADLLILESNPLESIENTRSIFGVVKEGKYFSRDDLNKMLKR